MRIAEQIAEGLVEAPGGFQALSGDMHSTLKGILMEIPSLTRLVTKVNNGPSGLTVGDVPKVRDAARKFVAAMAEFEELLRDLED